MRQSVRPGATPEAGEVSGHGGLSELLRAYGGALLACAVALVAIGVVILHPYVTDRFRYPLGWDAAFYVWRTEAIPVDGLDRVGTIRAGFPLLAAALSPVTGANGFTLVAVLPAVLAGVAGLGAAALLRAGLGLGTAWVPVAAFLAWAAFGPNEIPLHHLDNLLNAALVLTGLAAALAAVNWGRGAVAAGVLFAGAGLAHWPFYAVAMAVYVAGLAAWAWSLRTKGAPALGRLVGAAAGSAGFVGLTLLAPPPTGWTGARPAALRTILQERIRARLDDPSRFAWVLPAAAGAGALIPGGPTVAGGPRAELSAPRRLLLWWFAAWTALTLAGALAQVVGLPTAGARLLSFFFPGTMLVTVALWWFERRAVRRWNRGGTAAAATVALAAMIGFGALMWSSWSSRHPWIEEEAAIQVTAAAAYVGRYAPESEVVYILDLRGRQDPATVGRWWLVVKAVLPPEQVPRAHRYVGSPAGYLAGVPSRPLGEGLPPGETDRPDPALWAAEGGPAPVALVIRRYNPAGFAQMSGPGAMADRVVAPGVLVAQGPLPEGSVVAGRPPVASTGRGTLLWVSAVVVAMLFATGGGWAAALLPADAVIRTAASPALGATAIALAALAWDLAGLGFGGWAAATPLLVVAAAGWAAASIVRVRGRAPLPPR